MDGDAWLVFAIGLLIGIIYLRFAIVAGRAGSDDAPGAGGELSAKERVRRADDDRERISPWPRYGVAFVGFATAGALLAHLIPLTVAYALLVLALVARTVADLVAEERAPRRRSALLQRSRRIDPVILAWIALSSSTLLVLAAYVLDIVDRAAAIVVAACVGAMAVVAWRIASAPPLLLGNDLEAELLVDRETRTNRTGNTCIVAAGTVFVFVCYVGGIAHHSLDVLVTFAVWVGLILWKTIYARQVSRRPLAL